MVQVKEKILKEFSFNLVEREGFSIHCKVVDRSEQWEETTKDMNPELLKALHISRPLEQVVLTRSDKVEVSILAPENQPWKYEICVFEDVKGKVKGALKGEPFPGMEIFQTKEAALERAIELLMII